MRRSTGLPAEIVGKGESMKRYTIEIEGIEYRVEILEDRGEEALVLVDGEKVRVAVKAENDSIPGRPSSPPPMPPRPPSAPQVRAPVTPGASPGEVRAPMPALVTEVLVEPGENVVEGQVLLKIEAMKMENQLRSPIDGTVEEVCVSKGQEVQESQCLIKINPAS